MLRLEAAPPENTEASARSSVLEEILPLKPRMNSLIASQEFTFSE
jgi:hypothetical protein